MFQNCTLTFGATPSSYSALELGTQCYLSTTSFVDQRGDSFRYYFYCQNTQYLLTRVYVTSTLGSPYKDFVRYSWAMTASGNSCIPFLLSNGQIYSGGDASCVVTISG